MLDFLERLKRLPHAGKDDWSIGMKAHYSKRLELLLAFSPPGAQARQRAFRARLARV